MLTMFIWKEDILDLTHYDILSVKEDASYEEIRASYRAALLESHPDKSQNTSETSNKKFLKVQKAWEILSNSTSRFAYDSELRAKRGEVVTEEDIKLEDMIINDPRENVLEFIYKCQCGDYYLINDLDLGDMGYTLLRVGNKLRVHMSDDGFQASIVVPCMSCSLKIQLLIDADSSVTVDNDS